MVKPQTILLVDDHSLITTAMSALLQSMYPDVQIHVGATAKEAVELAEKYGDSADLMILDLGLPDSQGTDRLSTTFTKLSGAQNSGSLRQL